MLDELKKYDRVVGFKQTTRSIEDKSAMKIFLAEDVSPDIYDKISELCAENGIEIEYVESMKKLGEACRIDVSAAVAAIVKS